MFTWQRWTDNMPFFLNQVFGRGTETRVHFNEPGFFLDNSLYKKRVFFMKFPVE